MDTDERYHETRHQLEQCASVSVRNVTMRYPQMRRIRECLLHPFDMTSVTALEDISFQVREGEIVGILGVNGSGKTTLLKLLGGLLYPTEGTIDVKGFDTRRQNLAARAAVGYVLNEERSFYWRLSGRQNLEFFGALDNLQGQALARRIEDVLGMVGIEAAGDTPVSGYSSGMRQRLAIARGLLADPEILILDEPTKSLDPDSAEHFLDIIGQFTSTGRRRTLFLATHRFAEADALCTRLLILDRGHLLADASREDAATQYGSIEAFYHRTPRPLEEAPC